MAPRLPHQQARVGLIVAQGHSPQTVTIRALAQTDLPMVASLFLRQLGKPGLETADEASGMLQRTLLDDPWADEAIPSLVSVTQDGHVVGFIGSSVRRVLLDGAPLRAAYASHLVADPSFPNRTVGLFLLRAFLSGQQDLTLSDTATPRARELFVALGASPIHHLATGWFQVFRPVGTVAALGLRSGGPVALAAHAFATASPLLDRLTARIAGDARAPRDAKITGEALTPAVVLDHIVHQARPARIVPDYDAGFLEWLFAELGNNSDRGHLRSQLVRSRGSVVGWYVYFLKPRGLCRVLQVMTRERHSDLVVGELYRDAYAGGAAALYGRLEPHTSEAVLRRKALLRPIPRALVHTRIPAATDALQSGSSALSWLDGEPW